MLRRRSIRIRILVLVLVPLLALIGLYGVVLDLTLSSYLHLTRATGLRSELTEPVAALQLQLAAERRTAVDYMAGQDGTELGQLIQQQAMTDESARKLLHAFSAPAVSGAADPQERAAIGAMVIDLKSLNGVRNEVTNVDRNREDVLAIYSLLINDGSTVLNQAVLPLVSGPLGIQANGLVNLTRAGFAVTEEGDLIEGDLIGHSYPASDQLAFSQLSVLRRQLWSETMPTLNPVYHGYFNTLIPAQATTQLQHLEKVISAQRSVAALPISPADWHSAITAYSTGFQRAVRQSGAALQAAANTEARAIALRLIAGGGLGLLAIIATLAISFAVGRGLIRQLNELRLAAVELSSVRLPAAISRLRAGEAIELDAEAPPLEPRSDEFGQVNVAFNLVRRTAIETAIDESRIRRGVNEVFRNLARRNQSLLTRQLQLLDAMERRIHDPAELADLFRIDHLTTRMRRHAEGLLIVAGGSSGRIWREPVPLLDVMRAAVAEVEDYTRVRVTANTDALVAGHAVADLIHLLAELIENATMFSPANTPVRVEGNLVAHGLAVEVEDRGLGITERQVTAINEILASPPMFDISGTDQLGLFIAGQLASRHEIKVTLRGSAFGGTTAVALIPAALIVLSQSGDPAADGEPAALGGQPGLPGRELAGLPAPSSPREPAAAQYHGPQAGPDADPADRWPDPPALPVRRAQTSQPQVPPSHVPPARVPSDQARPAPLAPIQASAAQASAAQTSSAQTSTAQTSSAQASTAQASTTQANGALAGILQADGGHTGRDLPTRRPGSAWPFRTGQQAGTADRPGMGQASPDAYGLPTRVRQASITQRDRETGAQSSLAANPLASLSVMPAPSTESRPAPHPDASPDVRTDASDLAGQVAGQQSRPAPGPRPEGKPEPEGERSPDAARNTMSTWQRGWLRGRSQASGESRPPKTRLPATIPSPVTSAQADPSQPGPPQANPPQAVPAEEERR